MHEGSVMRLMGGVAIFLIALAFSQPAGAGERRETLAGGRDILAPRVAAQCGAKRRCSQMKSCKEACFYLLKCGLTRLDRDKDGIPCEKICSRPCKRGG